MTPHRLLIDLDAAVRIGAPLGCKRSTGYAAPELIRLDGAMLPDAQPTFDVWSLGVVLCVHASRTPPPGDSPLHRRARRRAISGRRTHTRCIIMTSSFGRRGRYQLCTGRSLFFLELNDDHLRSKAEEERLRQWRGADESSLGRMIFSDAKARAQLEDEELESARDLIAWMLEARPEDRPQSMVQVLSHRFLKPVGGLLRQAAKEVSIPWAELQMSDVELGKGAGGVVCVVPCTPRHTHAAPYTPRWTSPRGDGPPDTALRRVVVSAWQVPRHVPRTPRRRQARAEGAGGGGAGGGEHDQTAPRPPQRAAQLRRDAAPGADVHGERGDGTREPRGCRVAVRPPPDGAAPPPAAHAGRRRDRAAG